MKNISTWPIVAPLKDLFESRKFLLALSVIVTYLLTHAIPGLLPYADHISTLVLIVFGAVFAHLSAEDILILRSGLKIDVAQAVTDARNEVAGAVGAIITGPSVTTTTATTVGGAPEAAG